MRIQTVQPMNPFQKRLASKELHCQECQRSPFMLNVKEIVCRANIRMVYFSRKKNLTFESLPQKWTVGYFGTKSLQSVMLTLQMQIRRFVYLSHSAVC